MFKTRVFNYGDDQAIRIPEELRTGKEEFFIRRVGDSYILSPADDPWSPLRATMGTFPQDFMDDRNQPSIDEITKEKRFNSTEPL